MSRLRNALGARDAHITTLRGVIIVLVLLGQVLELRSRSRTNSAIKDLLGLAANTAIRIGADGVEAEVPLEQVVVVPPGVGKAR